ncbi:hypothetical protein LPJ56_006211, partial [Coemansia sp. RSA 2599]
MVRCLAGTISVCAPTPLVHEKYVASVWHDDWKLHIADSNKHRVIGYDPLSVTVGYLADEKLVATVPLVRGSAFTTVVFNSPQMLRLSTTHAVLRIDSQPKEGMAVVYLNNGAVWLVCCESHVSLQQSGISELESSKPICGTVRVALVSSSCSAVDDQRAAVESLLFARDAVPIGGHIEIDSSCEEKALFTISWRVKGSGSPLMYALPHHQMSMELSGPECYWVDSVAAQ